MTEEKVDEFDAGGEALARLLDSAVPFARVQEIALGDARGQYWPRTWCPAWMCPPSTMPPWMAWPCAMRIEPGLTLPMPLLPVIRRAGRGGTHLYRCAGTRRGGYGVDAGRLKSPMGALPARASVSEGQVCPAGQDARRDEG